MFLEIVVLSWFVFLILISIGKWLGDGDGDLFWGALVALLIPAICAFISLGVKV